MCWFLYLVSESHHLVILQLSQMDIVPILQNFDLMMTQDGLIVNNPPTVRFSDESEITAQDLTNMVK